jgi:hypothetical protein
METYSYELDTTFTLIDEMLYELIDNEWEPIDWVILAEDRRMYDLHIDVLKALIDPI